MSEEFNFKCLKKNLKFFLALFLVVIFGLLIRLVNLTSLPVFADEAIYIRWAQVMRAEQTLRFLPLSDGKQPLFMWVVIPFLKIFSDPLMAGRIVSVLTGVVTIIGVFCLTKLLFDDNRTAFLAALMATVTPFLVFFDRLALADSMLAMFGIWTLFFAVKTTTTLRLDFAMLGGFALSGALLTKSPALFFAILLPTALIMVKTKGKVRRRLEVYFKAIFLLGVTLLIGYGMYNILRLGPNFQLLSSRNQDYVFPFSHLFQSPFNPFFGHFKDFWGYLWLMGPFPLVILSLAGLVRGLKSNFRSTILILLWFILPLLADLEYAKVFTARYVLYVIPFLIVLASLSIRKLENRKEKIMGVVFGIMVIWSLWIDGLYLFNIEAAPLPRSERSGYLEEWTAGYGIKEASLFLRSKEKAEPEKKIVVGTEGYFGTLPDGLQMYLNDRPQITVIGVGLGIDKIPKSLAESSAAGNLTYLLINQSRLKVDPTEIGLTVISAYPKAKRPDGSNDSLLLLEVSPFRTN